MKRLNLNNHKRTKKTQSRKMWSQVAVGGQSSSAAVFLPFALRSQCPLWLKQEKTTSCSSFLHGRQKKYLFSLCLLSFLLLPTFSHAQQNPNIVTDTVIECDDEDEGRREAEVKFKAIKLNDRRRTNVKAAKGQPLIITAKVGYTKRAKVFIIKKNGDKIVSQKKRRKRMPVTNAYYFVQTPWTNVIGNGLTVTNLFAPDQPMNDAPVEVTYATDGCFCVLPASNTKEFKLDVGDQTYISEITATALDKDDNEVAVLESGHYLMKNQQQKIKFQVELDKPRKYDVTWSVTPETAGTFTGKDGAQGDTVYWKQTPNFVSSLEGDVVITANISGKDTSDSMSFDMTIFSINSNEEWALEPEDPTLDPSQNTYSFLLSNSDIEPEDADLNKIVNIMNTSAPEGVGNTHSSGLSLFTRTLTESWDVDTGVYYPDKSAQETGNPDALILKNASFSLTEDNEVKVSLAPGKAVGEVNLVWEKNAVMMHRIRALVQVGATGTEGKLLIDGGDYEKYIIPANGAQTISLQIDELKNITLDELSLVVDAVYLADEEQNTPANPEITGDNLPITFEDGGNKYTISLVGADGVVLDYVSIYVVKAKIMEIENLDDSFGFEPTDKICLGDDKLFMCKVEPEIEGTFLWTSASSKITLDDNDSKITGLHATSSVSAKHAKESFSVTFIPSEPHTGAATASHSIAVRSVEFSVSSESVNYQDLELYPGTGVPIFNAWSYLQSPKPDSKDIDWEIRKLDGGNASILNGVVTFKDFKRKYGSYMIKASPCGASMVLDVYPPPEPEPDPENPEENEDAADSNESKFDVWDEDIDMETNLKYKRYAEGYLLEVVVENEWFGEVVNGKIKKETDSKPLWKLDGSNDKYANEVMYNVYATPGEEISLFGNSIQVGDKRVYILSANSEKYTIVIYPETSFGIGLDINSLVKEIKKIPGIGPKISDELVEVLPDFDFHYIEGYEEETTSSRVCTTRDIGGKISFALSDPLEFPVPGLGFKLPLGKAADAKAGLFIICSPYISGKLALEKDCDGWTGSGGIDIGGKNAGISGILKLTLWGTTLGTASIDATTGFALTTKAYPVERAIMLKGGGKWDGINGSVVIRKPNGEEVLDVTYPFVNGGPIPGSISFPLISW